VRLRIQMHSARAVLFIVNLIFSGSKCASVCVCAHRYPPLGGLFIFFIFFKFKVLSVRLCASAHIGTLRQRGFRG